MMLLVILFLVGLVVGTQVNRGIYALAWNPRPIGPWSPPAAGAPTRSWVVRLPLLGWWFLRREAPLHGRLFWLRPMLIELATGGGFAALYVHEVVRGGAVPSNLSAPAGTLPAQYAVHCLLIALMLVATFIDFDERTIPDAITVPGALLGLLVAACFPWSRLLVAVPSLDGFHLAYLHVGSGTARPGTTGWPTWLDGGWGCGLGIVLFLAWWLAVLPWTWTTRRGLVKAFRYFAVSLIRRTSPLMVVIAAVGLVGVLVGWWLGGDPWQGLFSALLGMTVGGGLVWAFRVVGGLALRQEAMGFGDVTLMAMIGAFLGWQPAVFAFFLAPAAAVVISVAQWMVTGSKVIAFGPYLCLAAVFTLLRWGWLWEKFGLPIFSLGWFLLVTAVLCVTLTWALLVCIRFTRSLVGGRD